MKKLNPLDWLIQGAVYLLYKSVKNLITGGDNKSKKQQEKER